MSKKSIRFFNDREVRAVWDDENNKWWFSATDIVRAINDEDDYKKCRNYWKYLKGKMAKDGVELVSVTNHFKFQAPDGKQRNTWGQSPCDEVKRGYVRSEEFDAAIKPILK